MQEATRRFAAWVFVASTLAGIALADTAAEAYQAMSISPERVLSGTVLSANVVAAGDKQVVALTTFMSGRSAKPEAVNVRLDVFERREGKLHSLYSRDFGTEAAGSVGAGDLQLIDLDRDGLAEIIVSWDSFGDPLIDERRGEVIVHEEGTGFRTAWSGSLEYDATKNARTIAPERRDRFRREIDLVATMRTHGTTLVMNKEVLAVAGERLEQPKVVQETFPLQ